MCDRALDQLCSNQVEQISSPRGNAIVCQRALVLVAEMRSRFLFVHMRARMLGVCSSVCNVEMVFVTLEPCMAIEEQYPIQSMVGQSTDSTKGRVKNMARYNWTICSLNPILINGENGKNKQL